MDVKLTLVNNMEYIVGAIIDEIGNDDILENMYEVITHNIDINFDSSYFYFFEYKQMLSSKIKFKIDMKKTPTPILKMLIDLIEYQRMNENIKNKLYMIHFRKFNDKVYLEDKNNTIRKHMFLQLHKYIDDDIHVFLINKLTDLENKIKNIDDGDDDYVMLKIQEYRCKTILLALEDHTIYDNL